MESFSVKMFTEVLGERGGGRKGEEEGKGNMPLVLVLKGKKLIIDGYIYLQKIVQSGNNPNTTIRRDKKVDISLLFGKFSKKFTPLRTLFFFRNEGGRRIKEKRREMRNEKRREEKGDMRNEK